MKTSGILPTLHACALGALSALGARAAPLSGNKSVGPTGDYASVTQAIADIQSPGNGLGGPLVLELQAGYLGSVETFPLTIPAPNGGSAANTLTIRPETGATGLSISSADTTAATVDLNGAQFVIIDGRPGGAGSHGGSGVGMASQLAIENTSAGGVAVRFINEASGNALRFLTLQGVNTSAASGTVVFSTTTGANGNDNNTIDNCDIRDGATTPANALYSSGSTGTTAQNNSGNTVSNCNIFNFRAPTAVDATGVRLDGGNTDWTISGNSFYQTSSRVTLAAIVRAIYINNTSGNNFAVTGNFIGGDSPGAAVVTQKWTTIGTTAAYQFIGIHLRTGTTTPTSVQGNTIRNFAWMSSSAGTTAGSGPFTGIYVQAGNVNVGTAAGNIIGSGLGTDSIAVTTSGDGGTTFGIGSTSPGTVAIAGNTIGSITTNNTFIDRSAPLFGIHVTAGANTIAGNTVGSTVTANSLNAGTSSTAAIGQPVIGIVSSATGASITDNTVANLNNNYAGSFGGGQIRGIVTSAGVNAITGNTVRNLSTTSANSGGTTFASVMGISQSSTAAGQTVSQNTGHSLANTAASANISVTGIYFAGSDSGTNLIARNFIHSLAVSSSSANSVVSGVQFVGGTFTAQNNMVRVGIKADGTSTAGASTVRGIHDNGNGTPWGRNFYHNSVYLGGTQTSGVSGTRAFQSSGEINSRILRNNIFVNARSNSGGTGKHYAVFYGLGLFSVSDLTAGGNLFLASGTGGVLGYYNGDRSNLAVWQTATGQDNTSAVGDPRFVNPTGDASAVDLHLQTSNPAESCGIAVTVTDDFDGQIRSTLTPVDVGADAGNFALDSDVFAPAINYPQLTSGTTANRVLSGWASIVDNSGTIASGASAPRLYYKKSTDSDAFNVANDSTGNGWKYVTGTGGGSYSFTIDYTLINGGSVSVGDTIQYFVVAQDAANNLGSSPAAATASANPPVQNISAKPGVGVKSYNIIAPLGGTVTVGAGGTFTTLTGANGLFAALNSRPLISDLTAKIVGDTSENGSTMLNAFIPNRTNYPSVPTTSSVTIQPDSAAMRTISGPASTGLIILNGAQGVTIDGSFGGSGRYLRFRNTSYSGAAIGFINDASNNTVRNCVMEGTSGYVVAFGSGVTTGNDNNSVTGNQIRDRSDAAGAPDDLDLIVSNGTSDTVANSGNTISNNELFNFTDHAIRVASGSDSWTIMGNIIYQTYQPSFSHYGIYFNGIGINTIRGNTVRDLMPDGYGIYLSTKTGDTTVAQNRLWNLGRIGIYSAPGSGHSVKVVNNMVALGSSGASTYGSSLGIYAAGAAGSTTIIAYNSVLIAGINAEGSNAYAFYRSGDSSVTVKNNLFLNLRTGGGNHFAANYWFPSAGSLAMDYNVYAGTDRDTAANFFDGGNGVPISYAEWQANVPSDTHSSASIPGGHYTSAMFVDAANGDLHLVPGGNPLVNDTGTPIAGITTDFDGNFRSLTAPYIGADEFPGTPADLADPDGDRVVSLLEFAFGTDPLDPASGPAPLQYTGSPSGGGSITANGQPSVMSVATPGGNTEMRLLFVRRKDFASVGINYAVRFSSDLTNWTDAVGIPLVLADDGIYQVVSIAFPAPVGEQASKFARVAAIATGP